MYNPSYASLREIVHTAAYENTYDELAKTVEVSLLREEEEGGLE